MEELLLELAVLLDQVVQNVEALPRITNASHQGRHGPREERNREEELLLCAAEALQRHRTVPQCFEIGILQDVDSLEDDIGADGDARGSTGLTHGSDLRSVDVPDRPGLEPAAVNRRGGKNDSNSLQGLGKVLGFRSCDSHEQGRQAPTGSVPEGAP